MSTNVPPEADHEHGGHGHRPDGPTGSRIATPSAQPERTRDNGEEPGLEWKERGSGLVGFLACKSKVTAADFVVKESIRLEILPRAPVGEKGIYRVYHMAKTGWNTVDALIRIAKENRIALRDIQYGGKKDRHGQTEQFITCEKDLRLPDSLRDAVRLEHAGFSREPMRPGQLAGNTFTLVLRSLQPSETSHLRRNFEALQRHGFINYFDSQRFSTFDREEGLPAHALFAGNPEACLKQLLLGEFRREKAQAKDRKDALHRAWGDWRRCESLAATKVEQKVFACLERSHPSTAPGVFRQALDLLPFEELLMMFSAFQAYLWNHMIARYVEDRSRRAARFKTRTGILAFPHVDEEYRIDVDELSLPGRDETFDDQFRARLDGILKEAGLSTDCTQSHPLENASMNAYMRKVRVVPADLALSDFEDDELYAKRKRGTLSFTLPPGSYGTMLVKRLTLRARF